MQSYDLIVTESDWSGGGHYGGGNVFRAYTIPEDEVGGIVIRSFYLSGGLILGYAKITYDTGSGYRYDVLNTLQLPLLTAVTKGSTEFGIRLQLSPLRSEIHIAKSLNGWDAKPLTNKEIPDTIDLRLVFIEASNTISSKSGKEDILVELKSSGVDLNNYKAVMDYFGLDY